jgi:toxin-antitoxin system PIN domain toxin
VIAVDTNVLVYAHREDSEWHENAVEKVATLAEGRAPWAIPWPCIHEFLAIVTHPKIFAPPSPLDVAVRQVDAWLESPSVNLLSEGGEYWAQLKATITAAKVAGPQVHDARIAALCAQHGVRELWSADRDFNRFPRLTVVNPLITS